MLQTVMERYPGGFPTPFQRPSIGIYSFQRASNAPTNGLPTPSNGLPTGGSNAPPYPRGALEGAPSALERRGATNASSLMAGPMTMPSWRRCGPNIPARTSS